MQGLVPIQESTGKPVVPVGTKLLSIVKRLEVTTSFVNLTFCGLKLTSNLTKPITLVPAPSMTLNVKSGGKLAWSGEKYIDIEDICAREKYLTTFLTKKVVTKTLINIRKVTDNFWVRLPVKANFNLW